MRSAEGSPRVRPEEVPDPPRLGDSSDNTGCTSSFSSSASCSSLSSYRSSPGPVSSCMHFFDSQLSPSSVLSSSSASTYSAIPPPLVDSWGSGLGAGTPQEHDVCTKRLIQTFFDCLAHELARFEKEVHFLASSIKYPPPASVSSSYLTSDTERGNLYDELTEKVEEERQQQMAVDTTETFREEKNVSSRRKERNNLQKEDKESSDETKGDGLETLSSSEERKSSSVGVLEKGGEQGEKKGEGSKSSYLFPLLNPRHFNAKQLEEDCLVLNQQAQEHASLQLGELVESVRAMLWANTETLRRTEEILSSNSSML
ncbi:hypothetical protein CSUI_006873 [Cystoisospora suis]|uniref:Uncharacterized protein n=1 Tax=Cystoisospora suis TaxID=483139 RepID=A0A2C6KRZ6_9APIC|nr:hypothetical protein CSUI_006873 [Cystoisospora suis]